MPLHHLVDGRACLVAALLLVAACDDAPTPPAADGARVPIAIRAELTGTGVQALSVQVSGPAITTPIVVNVPVGSSAASATATLAIPVGGQRTLLVRGFDGDGVQTHEGLATVTVKPAGNAPVSIKLYPKVGDVPITIGGAAYTILITPPTLPDANVGDTRQLSAVVGDASGALVSGATVTWGSLNPVVASVDANGMLTARTAGTTTIHASWGGAATSVDLTVLGPPIVFREISAGAASTCALDDSGAAWCWGIESLGVLGVGGTGFGIRRQPTRVEGGLHFASITVGWRHACAVTLTGSAYCWGYDAASQLGSGLEPDPASRRLVPTAVAGGLTWARLAAGVNGTCGITTSGERYCWGNDSNGGLGLHANGGDPTSYPTPTRVPLAGPWSTVDIGGGHSCAVTVSGLLRCSPQPTAGSPFLAEVPGTDWRAVEVNELTIPEGTADNVPNVFINSVPPHACGLAADGAVRCWGYGAHGALGSGGVADALTPVAVAGQQGYEAVSVGGEFACALRSRAAFCWGRNDSGQLGDGSTIDRLVPTAVSSGGSFVRITAGSGHACALRADGTALCWGNNSGGQLGDGTMSRRHVPTIVARPLAP